MNEGRVALWVSLLSVPGIGFFTARQLLAKISDWETAACYSRVEWRELKLSEEKAVKLVDTLRSGSAWNILEKIKKKGIGVMVDDDPDYPSLLREIYYPPVALFYKGQKIKPSVGVAIVGTRKGTSYGLKVAQDLAAFLAPYTVSIISGLASGIDTAAHRGALLACGYTVAVLGSGVNHIYPAVNQALASQILSSGGTILSEYLPDTLPHKAYFPIRNRIISGMASAVVVVEAGERSGALITAAHAVSDNRDVYAVPGSIYSHASRGTHELLLDGAIPLYSFQHLIENLNLVLKYNRMNHMPTPGKNLPAAFGCEGIILAELALGLKSLPELHNVVGNEISLAVLGRRLTEMELSGKIVRKLDGRYGIS